MAKQAVISGVEAMLVARGLTAQHNVRVTMSEQCRTAMTSQDNDVWAITIPNSAVYSANAMEYLRGYLDHECAHVRFTDFDIWARDKKRLQEAPESMVFSTSQIHSFYNTIEDARIENLMSETFPGSRRNLCRLNQLLFDTLDQEEAFAEGLAHGNPQAQMVQALNLFTNYVLVRQYEHLYGVNMKADRRWKLLDDALGGNAGPELHERADDLARRAAENRDQKEVARLVKELMEMGAKFLDTVKDAKQEEWEQQGNARWGEALDDLLDCIDAANQIQRGETPNETGAAIGDPVNWSLQQDSQSNDGQSNDGQSGNAGQDTGQGTGQNAGHDGRSPAPKDYDEADYRRALSDNLSHSLIRNATHAEDKSAQAYASMERANNWHSKRSRAQTKEDDEDRRLIHQLGSTHVMHTAYEPRGDIIEDKMRAAIRALATQTGVKLRSVLQSMQATPSWSGATGIKLDQRVLYRPSIGDARIFRRREEKPKLVTDVLLLLDVSGSMERERIWETFPVVMATLMALRTMPNVRAMLAIYSEDSLRVLYDWTDKARVGLRMPACYGGTPTGPSMMNAITFFDPRRQCRKIMIVFTDGGPNDYDSTRAAVRHLNARGIETYAVGMGFEESAVPVFEYSGFDAHHVICVPDMHDFPAMLRDMIARAIRRDARCR